MSEASSLPFWKRAPLLSTYVAAIFVGGLLALALGSEPSVVALAVAGASLSTVPSFVFGARDLPSLITLSVGARYAATAIFWRDMTWQRLDLGLYDPHESFLVILLGVSAITCAAFVAHLIYHREPLFRERYSSAGLEVLVWLAAAVTVFGVFILSRGVQVLGGVSALAGTGITLLPLAWLARDHQRGKGPFTPGFICLLAALTILGIGSNSRQAVLQPITALIFFMLSFGVSVSRRTLMIGAVGALLFIGLLSPVMIVVRSARDLLSPAQMIALTIDAIRSGQIRAAATEFDRARELRDGPYAMHYTTGGGEVVQRFVEVEQMDILVDRAHRFGPIGTTRYWQAMVELLPSFIVPDKTVISTPSYAIWVYGLSTWGIESNPTETAFGDAYSYGGLGFVVTSMFATFLLLFVSFRMFCPTLEHSLFAAFIVAAYIHVFTEQNAVGLLGIPIREFSIELAVFWLVSRIREPVFALTGGFNDAGRG